MLNNCAKFHENQSCTLQEMTTNVTNRTTNKPTNSRVMTDDIIAGGRSQESGSCRRASEATTQTTSQILQNEFAQRSPLYSTPYKTFNVNFKNVKN